MLLQTIYELTGCINILYLDIYVFIILPPIIYDVITNNI